MGVGVLADRTDETLASELKTGNADALTILIMRHSRAVFAIARAILHDSAEAEEVVQQVFLDVYKTIDQFDQSKGGFRPWLLRKAEFRAIDQRRRLKTQGIYNWVDIDSSPDVMEAAEGAFHLSGSEVSQFVTRLLKVLSPREARVIKLCFFNGLTLKEVGIETKETPSAVRRLFYRSLKKLRMAAFGENAGKGN